MATDDTGTKNIPASIRPGRFGPGEAVQVRDGHAIDFDGALQLGPGALARERRGVGKTTTARIIALQLGPGALARERRSVSHSYQIN